MSTRMVDNMVFYDFDYSLETTRGNKRVVSTVCVSNNKLYIANGQYFCGQACAEDSADKLLLIKAAVCAETGVDGAIGGDADKAAAAAEDCEKRIGDKTRKDIAPMTDEQVESIKACMESIKPKPANLLSICTNGLFSDFYTNF